MWVLFVGVGFVGEGGVGRRRAASRPLREEEKLVLAAYLAGFAVELLVSKAVLAVMGHPQNYPKPLLPGHSPRKLS